MQRAAKPDLLVLDEFDPCRLSAQAQERLLELLKIRNGSSSTMIITREPFASWELHQDVEHNLDFFLSRSIVLELLSLPCSRCRGFR